LATLGLAAAAPKIRHRHATGADVRRRGAQLLLQLMTVTFGAFGLLVAADEELDVGIAIVTMKIKEGHGVHLGNRGILLSPFYSAVVRLPTKGI
jgi:hypothetical protein